MSYLLSRKMFLDLICGSRIFLSCVFNKSQITIFSSFHSLFHFYGLNVIKSYIWTFNSTWILRVNITVYTTFLSCCVKNFVAVVGLRRNLTSVCSRHHCLFTFYFSCCVQGPELMPKTVCGLLLYIGLWHRGVR